MRFLTLVIVTLSLTGCLALDGPEADGTQPTAVAAKKLAKANPAVGDAKHGEQMFTDNCARCHRTGAGGAPELNGVTARLTRAKFESVLDEGPKVMPSWKHLPTSTRDGLWAFLGAATPDKLAQDQEGGCGCGGACDGGGEGKGAGKGHGGGEGCGGGCGGGGGEAAAEEGCGGHGAGKGEGAAEEGCGGHGGGKGHGKQAKGGGGGCGCGKHG